MKKMLLLLFVCLILSGCGSAEIFETLSDDPLVPASAQMRQIKLVLPEDASIMTMQSENGTIYLCDDYEICLETLKAGDLDRTIRSITGYHQENLTVLKSGNDGFARYELVWSSAGESGTYLGRSAILDDGNYHYVLTVLAEEGAVPELDTQWNQMFASFGLS